MRDTEKNEKFTENWIKTMSFNNKRRFDENVVNDTDIADFLDRKPELYRHVQLSCYLEKLASESLIPFTIDRTSPELFCVSVLEGIKTIIRKIFTDAKFGDTNGSNELYCVTNSDKQYSGYFNKFYFEKYQGMTFTEVYSWIYYNDDDTDTFFEISGESFDIYLSFLSQILSTPTHKVVIKVNYKSDHYFEVSIVEY